jgi:hypothetical protein
MVVLVFTLKRHPILQRPNKMSKVQFPCRAHAAQNDSFLLVQLALHTPFKLTLDQKLNICSARNESEEAWLDSSAASLQFQSGSGRKSAHSIHEEIRLPAIVYAPHNVAYEHYVIRSYRFSQQGHLRFAGQAVSLLVVATHASSYKVFPGILTAFCSRYNVINCQRHISPPAAILTTMPIAP